ncbi:hypothetical protein FJY68_11360 [candidate division WOR-3 bacterium]|uniref:Uncharacterized protein n=1 Tax=candidate division WOR-3 bacterium TaxID=2052148 RepID=A0A937XJU2_UNCW3|nr:hypothetical protein [candidate division WOR-3 bacterium]
MKYMNALFVSFCLAAAASAIETPRETQLHRMSQVENSNRAVTQFLKGLSIPFKSDTIYVFIVPPMTAARIEGGINPFTKLLRQAGVKSDIVTLAVSEKRRAAQSYLRRRTFSSDYNIAADTGLLKSFVFSAGMLQVPFVAKFAVKTGEMLSSYSLMGSVDAATVAWFISDTSKPKAERPASIRPRLTRIKTSSYRPAVARRLKLLDTDEYPLSTTSHVSVNPSGTRFAFWDRLTYYVYVFDLTNGKMLIALHPDSSEEMKFISLPPSAYRSLKQMNLVNPMYLTQFFTDDTTLLITASLPAISMEVTNNDTNVGISNSPVIIRKSISNNSVLGFVSFEHYPDNTPGSYTHGSASFVPQGGMMFLPYIRGWPQGTQLLDENTPADANPFTDQFYERNTYQFAAYSLAGEFKGFWGRLAPRFETLRLGYLSRGGLVRYHRGRYYLSDQYSGKIYAYDENASLRDSIRIFDEPPVTVPAIDRTKDPERYILETFKQNFKARIADFLVTDDYGYALVLWDESQPIVYKVGVNDHSTRRYALPSRFQNREAKHCLLRQTPTGVVTASLLESPDETYYCEFKLP